MSAAPENISTPSAEEEMNKIIPKGWSTNTNSPYYREKYAKTAKGEIDKILLDKEKALKIRPSYCKLVTLYQRLIQGQLYLCNHLDPEGIYTAAKPFIEIRRLKEENVILMFWRDRPEMEVMETTVTKLEQEEQRMEQWKHDLEEFIETSNDGDTFFRRGVYLTDEDQDWVRRQVVNLGIFHITSLTKTRVEVKHQDLSKLETSGTEGEG